ncbi:hypothetical protein CHUAL_001947 [Chamberlinius hualienensis]
MEEVAPTRLELWDYISMTTLVILSACVGLYHVFSARRSKDTTDFLVTSKELGMFPLILSSVATFFSAVGMIAFPSEAYLNGLSMALMIFPVIFIAPLGSHLYLPVFYKLNKSSIFEYLELRFCRPIRIITSLIFSTQTLLYTSCVMYVPALALNQVTGLHLWASVVTIGIVCIIYTSMGGIKAVVWADVVQCLIMVAILTMIIIKSAINVGGFGVIWDRIVAGKRDEIFIWSSSPYSRYSVPTMIIANPFHMLALLTISQPLMQRYLSNKSLKSAQKSYLGGAVGVGIGHAIIVVSGILMYAYYYNCDPVKSGKVKLRDQTMALFAVETLSFCNGLAGVFVAGVMSATLSTLSSMLNSLSSITLTDYIKPLKPDMSNECSMKISRLLVVVFGIVCMAMVTLAENLGGIVNAVFGISGVTGGPMLGVFTAGMLLPWINSKGAIIGFVTSMILPTWAWVGNILTSPASSHAPISVQGCTNNWTAIENATIALPELSTLEQFYSVHAFWYDIWSLVMVLIVAMVVSKITGFQDIKQQDPDLYFPFIRKYIVKSEKHASNNNLEIEMEKRMNGSAHVIEPLIFKNKEVEIVAG